MNAEEKRIAREAIEYLNSHGLDFEVTWRFVGKEPPLPEIEEYLGGLVGRLVGRCLPSDEDEIAGKMAEMIYTDLVD